MSNIVASVKNDAEKIAWFLSMYFICRKSWTSKSCFGLFIWWISWELPVVQFKCSSVGISDKEKSIMFYLVGHVFPTFCPRPQFSKNSNQNSQEVLQECFFFLAGYTLGDK